jgi:hypothetical protein
VSLEEVAWKLTFRFAPQRLNFPLRKYRLEDGLRLTTEAYGFEHNRP